MTNLESFRTKFFNTKNSLEHRLKNFGLPVDADTMTWMQMINYPQNSRVTIDVPLNLIYSDEFSITGTLETDTYSRIAHETVKLKVGDAVVDSATTNVNGEYSFTQTPVSMGNHSFQVIFEGNSIYSASQSSIVTRTPDRETSVINLNAQSTKHYGDNVILSGTLLTDDGEYIKNASVKYYVNNSLISTLTTDNYGVFTAPTRTIDGFDSLNIQFVYEGDSNYTSVSTSQTIDVYQPLLSLTSDKSILSYADSESATLTATLNEAIQVPVVFYSGSPKMVNNCTDNSAFSTIFGSPTYSNNGLFLPSISSVISKDKIFNLTTSTYKIYLTCTKKNTHYLYAKIVNSDGGSSNSTIEINDTSIQFLDGNNINTPSGLGDTVDVLIEWGPSTQKLYIDGDLVATKSMSFSNNLNYLMISELISNEGFSVRNLVIYEDSNDEFVAHAISDSNGEATCTYNSRGAGDVEFTALCRNLVSETYSIRDALKVYNTEINNAWFNLNIPNMPSNFVMTYEAKNGSSNYGAFAFIGEEEANGLICGQDSSNSKALWQIGYGNQSTSITSPKTTNTYYPCEIKYDNGVWTATLNGAVITRNEVYTHREYVGFRAEAQGYIKNVIVMPL